MKQNWEKEFDKLLSECVFGNGDDTNLKVFISKLIRQAEKEEKEKETWDRVFKKILKETAAEIFGKNGKVYTFNDYAKQEIKGLLRTQVIEVNNSYAKSVLVAESLKAQVKEMEKTFERLDYQINSYYRAYDTSELGEMLPRMIKIDDKKVKNKHKKIIGIFKLHFYKNDYEWLLQYKEWHGDKGLIITDAKTEAEARGKMYFYLLDNDLL